MVNAVFKDDVVVSFNIVKKTKFTSIAVPV